MPIAGIEQRQDAPGVVTGHRTAADGQPGFGVGSAFEVAVVQQKGHVVAAELDVALKHAVAVAGP